MVGSFDPPSGDRLVSLHDFVEVTTEPDRSLVLVNWDAPRPLRTMVETLFDEQPVDVHERELATDDTNVVYLIEDGEVLATSPLSALRDAILLVNSDLYRTGAGGVDGPDVPDVIREMTDDRFRLRGYPKSHSEKLLLIAVSRRIERLAVWRGDGTLRTGFQRLSRIEDEHGTRSVYERLADSGTDTHVYGIPDWTPPPELEVTMHGGWNDDFRDGWFVVYDPGSADGRHAVLVAIETEPRRWDGFWTYDPDRVSEIAGYIESTL
jgi:hypothetical protein